MQNKKAEDTKTTWNLNQNIILHYNTSYLLKQRSELRKLKKGNNLIRDENESAERVKCMNANGYKTNTR
jgi:hypothetical protein